MTRSATATAALRAGFRQLWSDDRGVVWTIELVLTCSVLALGSIVGLATFRDAVVQEFGDLAAASAELDQSYTYSAVSENGVIGSVNFNYTIAGSTYSDETNFCEPTPTDPSGAAPMCITFGGTSDEN